MESATERSERKRQREKQRRSDLAAAFDALANTLLQIEPGMASGRRSHPSGPDTSDTDNADMVGQSSITRLDLIAETVEGIRRLHDENLRLKAALIARGGQSAVDDALQVRIDGSA
jgi:hypothetical protein